MDVDSILAYARWKKIQEQVHVNQKSEKQEEGWRRLAQGVYDLTRQVKELAMTQKAMGLSSQDS